MSLKEYYSRIYKLSFITRYSSRFRIVNEDVAQHSFFVAAIVLKLYDEYSFNLGRALTAAVSHDILESDLGDISYILKSNHPNLNKAICEIEQKELEKYPNSVKLGINIYNNNSSVESKIVHLADVIQVQQYISMEKQLGNTSMKDIQFDILERLNKLREGLQPYERNKRNSKKKK